MKPKQTPHRSATSRFLVASAVLAVGAVSSPGEAADEPPTVPATSLREAAEDNFLVGVAVMAHQLDDPKIARLVAQQYSSLTPENEMKPDALHPQKGVFKFETADKIADFAQAHDMKLIGHTLIWHQQTPKWLFEDENGQPLAREEALANMREHIQTIVKHFKGRVHGWDVVNEAIDDSGPYLRDTPALRAIGEDYVVKAFQFAREADPNVELYYNDYNIERDYKREKVARLLQELEAAGVKPDAVGIQGHWLLGSPDLAEIERGIKRFTDMGYKVEFTEVDVDVLPRDNAGADLDATQRAAADPYTNGLPAAQQKELADRYRELFELFLKHDAHITRVTLWGTHDGHSWLNSYPVRGRTNHALLFNRDLEPKPAFDAVVEVLEKD